MSEASDNDDNTTHPPICDADIDEVEWDELCTNPYQQFIDQGHREGHAAGLASGFEEGRTLGRSKATEIGIEIGFMLGFAKNVLLEIDNLNLAKDRRDKIHASVTKLVAAIEDFPSPDEIFAETQTLHEDENTHSDADGSAINIVDKVQRIRAKFKLVTVQLKVPHFSIKSVFDDVHIVSNKSQSEEVLNYDEPLKETEW